MRGEAHERSKNMLEGSLPQTEHRHMPAGMQVLPAPTLAQVVDETMTSRGARQEKDRV